MYDRMAVRAYWNEILRGIDDVLTRYFSKWATMMYMDQVLGRCSISLLHEFLAGCASQAVLCKAKGASAWIALVPVYVHTLGMAFG